MYFTYKKIERIASELKSQSYPDSILINFYKIKKGNFTGGEDPVLDDSGWDSFTTCDRWEDRDSHCWFRTRVCIPDHFHGKPLVYQLRTERDDKHWDAVNPQFFLYINGELIAGLDTNHREVEIIPSARAGDIYNIALNAYSGMEEASISISSSLAVLDKEIEKLYYNIKVPLGVAALLDEGDKKRIDILEYLDTAINMLDLRRPFNDSYYNSVRKANEFLEIEFYDKYCYDQDITTICVGHTHIDVAWLWSLAQTRQKAGRSFSTVLNLMDSYPEYIFMSSQPQLYKFIKEDYPLVYEKIRQSVREGRWEPEGAMWLEADCNLTSGESLVRQILFGTRFFEEEFGIKNKVLWLPDVFGYSAALPQILKKSGIDYFVTSKISWNEYNKLPYDTFLWQGMDGSKVFTYFLTACPPVERRVQKHATTYNGVLDPAYVYGTWTRYQQKNLSNEVLLAFGYGDGGGGPTKEMLENYRRLEKGIPGCPQVKMGTVRDFLERLDAKIGDNDKLPEWVGELYLEYHRGTYTSMARNKKFNRKSEFMMQDIEWLSTINKTIGSEYPQEKINENWETILLNQFHDILPGSSIRQVYIDSLEQYNRVFNEGRKMIEDAVSAIASKIDLPLPSIVVYNQLGFDRSDIVEAILPENCSLANFNGKPVKQQRTTDGKTVFFAENMPSKGYQTYSLATGFVEEKNGIQTSAPKKISNRFFDIVFDDGYNITSLFDKRTGREAIRKGERANVLQAFEDKPLRFDAWDINLYYQDKMWELNEVTGAELIEDGPVRTALRIERSFLDSVITQTIIIYHDIPRIDFKNLVDWKEKHILLKAAFPVDVHAEKATYDIQYGNVERPTHWNTSWDYARFEVCGHKWADLSEDDYGVSLMNDCKYGYDIKDGVIRLTLLKSAISPNEDADREMHEFTYSLFPHEGGWREAGTVQMAYSLNCPAYSQVEKAHQGSLAPKMSVATVNCENVIIEVIKKAEDSEDIVVRLYECYNRRSQTTLQFFREFSEVWECDLMENDIEQLSASGNSFSFEIKPYEIKTFKIKV